jgi:hypothetical protein
LLSGRRLGRAHFLFEALKQRIDARRKTVGVIGQNRRCGISILWYRNQRKAGHGSAILFLRGDRKERRQDFAAWVLKQSPQLWAITANETDLMQELPHRSLGVSWPASCPKTMRLPSAF